MMRYRCWLLAVSLCLLAFLNVPAQTRKTVQKSTRTSSTQKAKTTSKTQTTRKSQTTKKTKKSKTATPQPTVKGLQSQRQKIQQQIKEQERRLQNNKRDVKKRLENLLILNSEIADKRKAIDTIRRDITTLDGNIIVLDNQLKTLEKELDDRKQKFQNSLRYMHRNRSIQNRLMFVFSAKNFTQMYRRMRFMREYAGYQRVQGEAVKVMKQEVSEAKQELANTKRQKNDLLYRGVQEQKSLEGKQEEQKQVVSTLQKQQKTIEGIISEQRKKDQALNAQIDRLIAEEVARAKARAEAEARRKAAEEAAKKRAAELARKKAAAEAARRENERRIAEAKAREERAKAEARAAARKSAEEKAAAEREAREAETARREAERQAAADAKVREKEIAEVKQEPKQESYFVSTEDQRISGSFESNKGRLPMPITGPYRIVSHFGQYNVEGLKNVTLDNKGINIKGQPGAQARSIFDGEVSAVFGIGGIMGVMIRHGSYISVYCNLSSVSVRKGQKVSTRQALGTIGSENILQFQLRKQVAKLNPESWLGR
ncbi:MAG: peptidoglycan DD-metalloendopeptidase family protein [Prevotella sp.]|nr:peptidoglycan DD-metalloendopeptidase family protein [Prevotella sp.]